MAEATKIQWAHDTFNPWIGCVKVSPGCEHCYAEAQDHRWGHKRWGPTAPRTVTSDAYWKKPLQWNAEAAASGQIRRVFCASLADVCEDRDDLLEPRARLMRLIEQTPALTWMLTTKRPENFERFFGVRWSPGGWPANVWVMATAEDQQRADARLPHLMRLPAAVRAISYEPALGPLDLRRWLKPVRMHRGGYSVNRERDLYGLDWVICGAESGPGARAFTVNWARAVRDDCAEAGAAFFMKQVGKRPFWDRDESVIYIKDHKGGDPDEWPSDLRVREFPRG